MNESGLPMWSAWHLFAGTTAQRLHERLLIDVVAPLAEECGRPWFFIRYWQAGPHLRLRVHDLDGHERTRMEGDLRAGLRTVLSTSDAPAIDQAAYEAEVTRVAAVGEYGRPIEVEPLRPVGVYPADYEPERERYGGTEAIAASELAFGVASRFAAAFLARRPDKRARLLRASRATAAVAAVMDDDPALFLANGLRMWRQWGTDFGYTESQLDRLTDLVPSNADELALRAPLKPFDPGPLAAWHDAMTSVALAVSAAAVSHPAAVLFSHVHMLHNRIGLSVVEELGTYGRLAGIYARGVRATVESATVMRVAP